MADSFSENSMSNGTRVAGAHRRGGLRDGHENDEVDEGGGVEGGAGEDRRSESQEEGGEKGSVEVVGEAFRGREGGATVWQILHCVGREVDIDRC